MNEAGFNEAETRAELIDPALAALKKPLLHKLLLGKSREVG